MHHHRAVAAAFFTATLITGISACATSAGSTGAKASGAAASPKATESKDPLASLSADRIATEAISDTRAATSLRMTVAGTDSGQKINYAVTMAAGKGCQGTLAEPGLGSLQILEIGSSVWMLPSQTFLKKSGASDPAVLNILNGKWLRLKAGSSGFSSLASICTPSALASHLPSSSATGLAKGGITTFHAQRVLKIKDTTEAGYLYVSDTAKPELITFVEPGSGGDTVTFSDWNAPVTLTPPPASQILDGSKYGF